MARNPPFHGQLRVNFCLWPPTAIGSSQQTKATKLAGQAECNFATLKLLNFASVLVDITRESADGNQKVSGETAEISHRLDQSLTPLTCHLTVSSYEFKISWATQKPLQRRLIKLTRLPASLQKLVSLSALSSYCTSVRYSVL